MPATAWGGDASAVHRSLYCVQKGTGTLLRQRRCGHPLSFRRVSLHGLPLQLRLAKLPRPLLLLRTACGAFLGLDDHVSSASRGASSEPRSGHTA